MLCHLYKMNGIGQKTLFLVCAIPNGRKFSLACIAMYSQDYRMKLNIHINSSVVIDISALFNNKILMDLTLTFISREFVFCYSYSAECAIFLNRRTISTYSIGKTCLISFHILNISVIKYSKNQLQVYFTWIGADTLRRVYKTFNPWSQR